MHVEIDWSPLHLNADFFDKIDDKQRDDILNYFLTSAKTVVDTVASIVQAYPLCRELFSAQISVVRLVATTVSAPVQKVGNALVVTAGYNSRMFAE